MGSLEKGRELLRQAERGMRDLMAEAASEGEYDAVMTLTGWASGLSQLAAAEGVALGAATPRDATDPSKLEGREVVSQTQKAKSTASRRKKSTKTKVPSGYPKFFRRGDDLVKVGWSKRSKEEYQHTAPRHVVALVTKALATEAEKGELVSAHDLTPLHNPADEAEVPGYQVYLCLAWLRQNGLIQQKGRQGYTVPSPEHFQGRVEEKWRELPTG